jgi:hypothetical protein
MQLLDSLRNVCYKPSVGVRQTAHPYDKKEGRHQPVHMARGTAFS